MTYDLIEPSELDVELSFQQPAFPEPTADDLAYLESDHQRHRIGSEEYRRKEIGLQTLEAMKRAYDAQAGGANGDGNG